MKTGLGRSTTPADIHRMYQVGIAKYQANLDTLRNAFALRKKLGIGEAGLAYLSKEALKAEAKIERMTREYAEFCQVYG